MSRLRVQSIFSNVHQSFRIARRAGDVGWPRSTSLRWRNLRCKHSESLGKNGLWEGDVQLGETDFTERFPQGSQKKSVKNTRGTHFRVILRRYCQGSPQSLIFCRASKNVHELYQTAQSELQSESPSHEPIDVTKVHSITSTTCAHVRFSTPVCTREDSTTGRFKAISWWRLPKRGPGDK